MANWVGLAGPSRDTDKVFLEGLKPDLALFDGLGIHHKRSARMACTWAMPTSYPCEHRMLPDGTECFVLGEISDPIERDALFGLAIENSDFDHPPQIAASDGLHLTCVVKPDGTVFLAADWMGLFPIYYDEGARDRLLAATFLSAFRSRPGVSPALDIDSLVELLLLSVIGGGSTLLAGVRRLGPGCVLAWKPGAAPREVLQYRPAASAQYFKKSFSENMDCLDQVMQRAVQSAGLPAKRSIVLLSGGLDSRLLAAYADQSGLRPEYALTQGLSGDWEMKCARAVARELDWPHRNAGDAARDFLMSGALWKIDQEGLTHGSEITGFAALAASLSGADREIWSGAYGDLTLGYSGIKNEPSDYADFETQFKHMNHSGFSVQDLRDLVRPDVLKDRLESVLEKIRSRYESLPGEPFQRMWLYDLLYYDRFKVSFPRWMTFAGVSRVPFVRRELVEVLAGMPISALGDRRAEREMLCRRFPRLAAIALDRNSHDLSPAYGLKRLFQASEAMDLRTKAQIVSGHLRAKLGLPFRRLVAGATRSEKRFYHRILDVRGSRWKAIRRSAESGRSRLELWLSDRALAKWLPRPDEAVPNQEAAMGAQRIKMLAGLSIWLDRGGIQ